MYENLNPLDLLKEEMTHDEVTIRVNAIHRLRTVVTVMGTDSFKTQILPYVEGLLKKEEDEVLFAIADELGKVSTLLSGSQLIFLPPLEQLAAMEETVVRDRAVASLNTISNNLTDMEIQNNYVPMVLRLSSHDWFTGRVSAVNLIHTVYSRTGSHKDKLRQKFIELCNEETPMIRRAVASKIGDLAGFVDKEVILNELIPIFKQLAADEQDSVKVLCLDSLKQIAKLLNKEENKTHTLPIIIAATEDKSWKIRLALAKNFAKLAESFGKEITDISLIQIFTTLLKDVETDVRLATVHSLVNFIQMVNIDKLHILLPHIQSLTGDNSSQVRYVICDVIGAMIPLVPKELVAPKLLPCLSRLLEDSDSEVRINASKSSVKFVSVMGPELMTSLTPQLKVLLEDKKWRVREQIYNTLFDLANTYQSQDIFTKHIENLLFGFLKDRAQTIRENSIKRLPSLLQIYKHDWLMNSCLPRFNEILNKQNGYAFRISGLYSLQSIAQSLSTEIVTDKILPILMKNSKDDVPNVKLVAVRIIKSLLLKFESNTVNNYIKPLLQELSNDVDKDVKYFAQEALISI